MVKVRRGRWHVRNTRLVRDPVIGSWVVKSIRSIARSEAETDLADWYRGHLSLRYIPQASMRDLQSDRSDYDTVSFLDELI